MLHRKFRVASVKTHLCNICAKLVALCYQSLNTQISLSTAIASNHFFKLTIFFLKRPTIYEFSQDKLLKIYLRFLEEKE